MTKQDIEAARVLLKLGHRLLINDIDYGEFLTAICSVLDHPEEQPRYFT